MYGLTRGMVTLVGAALAGGLIWLASWVGPRESMSEYWIAMALVAGAGLVMAVSQLLGGWTKWGLPAVSGSVLGLGFLPALIAGGWILVAAQPEGSGLRERVLDWSGSIGLSAIVADLTILSGAIAFALGLIFGLIFDTTGPRRRDEVVDDDRYVAEEPTTAERHRVESDEREYARDGRHVDDTPTREREPVAAGRVGGEERATPVAPQPEPDSTDHPRRRSFFRR